MWRVLGIFINPLGALFLFIFGWIGRKIDSWFSPAVGMVAAILVCVFALSVSGAIIYVLKDEIRRAVGLIEATAFTRTDGNVLAITNEVPMLRNKIAQDLVVVYAVDGGSSVFEDSQIVPRSERVAVGDDVPVYLIEGQDPDLAAPREGATEIILVLLAALVSALLLYWASRYFRYRQRVFLKPGVGHAPQAGQWSPSPAAVSWTLPSTPQPVVLRGKAKPLSTADRIKADAERVRQTRQK